jgi:hypothetical protein
LADAPGNGNGAAISMILLYGLGIYFLLGLISAIAFVTFGVTQVLPYSMSLGARLLVLPGATALWPYVLARWLKSRQGP